MRNMKTVSFDQLITLSRPSPKWVWNAQGQLIEVPANQPAYNHDPVTGEPLGLDVETAATNLLLNSDAPATQIVGVTDATTYTLSVYGSGSAEITVGGVGTATDGAPLTFTTTGASVEVAVTGSLDYFQLELGDVATSIIITDGSAATREADVPVIENVDTAPWFGFTNGWTASLVCLAPDIPNEVYGFAMVLGPADLQRIGFYLYNGRAYAQFRHGSIFSVSVPYQPGEKISFAASYDPVTSTRSIAVNGTTDSDSTEMNFSESNVRLGNQFSGSGGGSFNISQMRFKKGALAAVELQELTS